MQSPSDHIELYLVKLHDQSHKEGRKFVFVAPTTIEDEKAIAAMTAALSGSKWRAVLFEVDEDGNPIT